VYTPEDGDNWMLAKLNVQVTDLGYSQIVEHLAKVCHYYEFLKLSSTSHIIKKEKFKRCTDRGHTKVERGLKYNFEISFGK